MTVEIKLYKKEGTYTDKNGKEKQFINFYIQANDTLIPFEVKYFPNPKFDDRDPGYQSRVAVLALLAEPLPEREKTEGGEADKNNVANAAPAAVASEDKK